MRSQAGTESSVTAAFWWESSLDAVHLRIAQLQRVAASQVPSSTLYATADSDKAEILKLWKLMLQDVPICTSMGRKVDSSW